MNERGSSSTKIALPPFYHMLCTAGSLLGWNGGCRGLHGVKEARVMVDVLIVLHLSHGLLGV